MGRVINRHNGSRSKRQAVVYHYHNARDPLPVGQAEKADARERYETLAALCCRLAATVDEFNCVVALVDVASTGRVSSSFRVSINGLSDDDDDLRDEAADANDGFVPPPHAAESFPAQTRDDAQIRLLLDTTDFPPAALLWTSRPSWLQDDWSRAHVRTRRVAIWAIAQSWRAPQTRARLAMRALERAGIVTECNDYFCLSPMTLCARLAHLGLESSARAAFER